MHIRRLALAAAVLMALAGPVLASTTTKGNIYTTITGDETAALLEGRGLSLTRKTSQDGRPIHVFMLNGIKTSLYHYNCDSRGECTALQLYVGLAMTNKPTREKINEWNRSWRFTRAYIDSDGDPCLEMDLDLEGGTSIGAINEMVRSFQISTSRFMDHVGFQR